MKKTILTDTILVASITLTSYLSLVCYQYRFLHYFGLPSYFLEFDLMTMLFIVLILIALLAFSIFCVMPLVKIISKRQFNLKRHFLILLAYYLPVIPMVIVSYDLSKGKIFNLIFALLFLIAWTLQIKFLFDKSKKLEGEIEHNVFDKIENKFGFIPTLFFMFFLLFLAASFLAGKSLAQWQEEYLVINTETPLAIIKPYGDSFITVSFDKNARTFGRNIFLVSKADISNRQIKITREHIGPLTNGSFYIESDIFTTFARKLLLFVNQD